MTRSNDRPQATGALLQFEELVADIAAQFVNLEAERIDSVIDDTLRRLAEALDVDRSALTQFIDAHGTLVFTHFWSRQGAPPPPRNLIAAQAFPLGYARIMQGELHAFSSLDELPRGSPDRAYAEATGIKASATVPFVVAGRVIGSLSFSALHERPWPPEIVSRLRLMAQVYASALARRQAEAGLRAAVEDRVGFEALVADVASRFVNLGSDRIDAAIQDAQRRLVLALDVDRSALFQFSKPDGNLVFTHAWSRPTFPSLTIEPNTALEMFPWTVAKVRGREIVRLSSLDDVPPDAPDREHFRRIGTKSNVSIPLIVTGEVIGALTFAALREERQWSDEMVNRLSLIGQVFASALARKGAEAGLRESEARFRALVEHAPESITMLDVEQGVFVDCNENACRLLQLTRGALLTKGPADLSPPVQPDGRPSPEGAREQIQRAVAGESPRFEWTLRNAQGDDIACEVHLTRLPSSERVLIRASVVEITERKIVDNTLHFLAQRGWAERGEDFSTALARFLGETLSLDYVFIDRVTPEGGTARTLANYWLGEIRPNFDYALADTPCEQIFRKALCTYAARVQQAFPRDSVLVDMGAESYSGIPLWDTHGDPVGLIALLHRQPIEHVRRVETVLQLVASYAGQEIARLEAEVELRRSLDENTRLREQLTQENVYLRREMKEREGSTAILGQSPAIRHVLDEVDQVAPTPATVLLLGETGTGKELVATAIHERSPRGSRAMVRVNCSAIPATLIESELFGREKGAYTGALARQAGRFELADGSTLFLDEIGELSPEVQVKLLRVLQEKEIQRLGGTRSIKIDVRVIAATNRDLERAIGEGTFREDLYYRLNVFPISVPPLRDRPEDIPTLVWAFVDEFSRALGKRIESISKEHMLALQRHPWPGNVRELRNAVERAVIVSTSPRLAIEPPRAKSGASRSLQMRDVEREHVRSVLERTGWRVRGEGGAAELLGLKPSTLEERMTKLELRRPRL